MATTFHIGTYDKTGGRGLVPVTLAQDGTLSAGEPYAGARNASFGARRDDLIYLVDEQEEGALTVHQQDTQGWHPLARVPSGGAEPCYVALEATGTHLAAANYASGSAALYRLGDDGVPQGLAAMFQDHGHGPNPERQEGPHAHCVRFHDGALYMVDLGTDQVVRLALTDTGFGEASVAFTAPAGAGPRHLLFHPAQALAVLLSELAATVTLLRVAPLGLEALDTVLTAPADYRGESAGGHLALSDNGSRVYASNRGHDSLSVFSLRNGHLDLLQRVPSGGRHPRHFAFVGNALVVAHEKDCRVTAFALADDGTLRAMGEGLMVPGACFVLA